MRQIPLVGTFLLLAAFSMPVLVGCKPDTRKPDPQKPDDKKPQKTAKDIEGDLKGYIVGTVTFDGEAPKAEDETRINDSKEKSQCMAGGGNHTKKQEWLVGKDGAVENVIVSLKPEDGWKFKIDDKLKEKYKKEVELDQPYCAYVPHVVGIFADVQELVVKNTAKVTHNTKFEGSAKANGKKDTGSIGAGESKKIGVLKMEAEPMSLSCSMHGWMNGYIVTFDHPYFAVTKADGKFKIENVPVGAKLSVLYWHEVTKERTVTTHTITEGENKIDIKIKK
ncbi:MAG: hypothetical protein FJ303_24590 [Planctomycetes bacterium]|nr:hypothetical protein [Planctomycetota bacterium]